MRGLNTLKKKTTILIVLSIFIVIGVIFTINTIGQQKKLEEYTTKFNIFNDAIDKLHLNTTAEALNKLLEQYNLALDNKDFKRLEELDSEINLFTLSLEQANIAELENKIIAFKNLDISKLNDTYRLEINDTLQIIEELKSEGDFKNAITEIGDLITSVATNIKTIIAEEEATAKKLAEEKRLAEEKQKKDEEIKSKENNSSKESIEQLLLKALLHKKLVK